MMNAAWWPEWSSHVIFSGDAKPGAPSSVQRASLMVSD